MRLQDCELDETISKTTQNITLCKTRKGNLEINKDTLAIPIRHDGQLRGFVFRGQGRLLIDTIVETEEGAIGKPVDKELTAPFLMIGDLEETQKYLAETSEEDLAPMGYQNRQEFKGAAEILCNQFFGGWSNNWQHFKGDRSHIFAIRNEEGELDILVVKDSKLVYKANDATFVSNDDKVVLKTPNEVVCSSNEKSVIVYEDKSVNIER
jgi:hypothetical protein